MVFLEWKKKQPEGMKDKKIKKQKIKIKKKKKISITNCGCKFINRVMYFQMTALEQKPTPRLSVKVGIMHCCGSLSARLIVLDRRHFLILLFAFMLWRNGKKCKGFCTLL